MTRIRRINVSQVEGGGADNTDTGEIRPNGETAFYIDESGESGRLTLMMFNGTRTHRKSKVLAPGILWGSNADSSDGLNYDTIKLIPDAQLKADGSDQYIVVDPTFPGHIHIRAGGTIDNSGADLYLGGENSYVKIPNGPNPDVIISANSSTWAFGSDGILTLPSGASKIGSLYGSDAILASTGTAFGIVSQGAGSSILQWVDDIGNSTAIAGLAVNPLYASTGSVQIFTGAVVGPTPQYAWTFSSTGTLHLPGSGEIKSLVITNSELGTTTTSVSIQPPNGWDANMRLDIYPTEGGEGNHLHLTAGDQTTTDLYLGNDSQFVMISGIGGHILTKARDGQPAPSPGTPAGSGGDIVFYAGAAGSNNGNPGDGATAGGIYMSAGASTTGTGGSVQIVSGWGPEGYGFIELSTDGNSSRWKFNRANELEFPDGSVQTTAWAGGAVVSVPSTSKGASGDKVGYLAFSSGYIYYCTAEWIDGTADIWKRVAWSGDTW